MANDIKAPVFPESIADGTVAAWHKQPGDYAERDELLVDIETDKVVLEVVAPDDGTLQEVLKNEGDVVQSEEVLGRFEIGAGAPSDGKAGGDDDTGTAEKDADESENRDEPVGRDLRLSPAARKLIDERDVPAEQVKGSGRGGLVLKEDVLDYLEQQADQGGGKAKKEQTDKKAEPPAPERDRDSAKSDTDNKRGPAAEPEPTGLSGERVEKRVPMTRMRARIAERLMDARRNTAMLTTFNEVDMQPVMQLRERYRDRFESRHGVRLGFMGFFVKAATEVLKRFPMVNASIDGSDVVYHGYQDIGIAVSTDRGLVVPILRETDAMGIADIEARIVDFGKRAHDGKLSIEDMRGGTFTITNGGVFGSLLSTPILNPPQSAILGMHKIEKRPVVIGDAIEIRPMMYLALSYDHRLVDGKDSVQFLVAIKELLEDPARILLDV